jgi:hypothetical protein
MNRILTKHGERNELAKLCKVSLPTVRSALNGDVVTELSIKIRQIALERGGVEIRTVSENDKE